MKINESYKPLLKNWLYGIAFYFIPFVVGFLAFRLILSDNVLHTDVDSARYMLSALVQSEAAIVALVVTLSLVAVQLAAQSYSARVIEVFRRTPDLWILMGVYGIAIFYGLGMLKMIENPQVGRWSNLEGQVSFSYYLGVFTFVALVPYIWKILDMLKPSTVINMLAERITKENILLAFDNGIHENPANPEKDPIQPIIDMVRGSLGKYDYETVRTGLNAIRNRTIHIFKNEKFQIYEQQKIFHNIFSHIANIGKQSANIKDEDSIVEVINCLEKIVTAVSENGEIQDVMRLGAQSIRNVGMQQLNMNLIIRQERRLFLLDGSEEPLQSRNVNKTHWNIFILWKNLE